MISWLTEVYRFKGAIVRAPSDGASLEFVERLFGQAGVGDGSGFPDGGVKDVAFEHIAQKRNNLGLGDIVRDRAV